MTAGDDVHQGLLVSGRFPELEDALCERVELYKRGRLLAPLTVIVGSAAVRTRVGDLLVRRLGGVANVRVVTLGRFAADLVAQRAEATPFVLGGPARERLARRLVAAQASALTYFAPVIERPHFAAALSATFADLREGCVEPGARWTEAATQAAGAPAQHGRALDDVRRLYAAFCRELDVIGATDRAGVLRAAAAALTAGDAPAPHVVLYGIYDLNRAQERLAAALLSSGADAFVPVPRDGERSGATLLDVAVQAGVGERRLEAPPPQSDRERVSAIWGTGDGPRELALSGDGSLRVVSVADERAEAREAVRAVVAAAEQGIPLHDCAVLVPRGDDVELLAAALVAAGLPVACRRADRSPGQRLLLALAECLAPRVGEPFARRAVIDLLTAAPLRAPDVAPGDVALWLDEAREAGVVCGLEQWVERVAARRGYLERRVPELEAGALDIDDEDDGGERVERTRARLRAARGLEAAVGALARSCRGLPARADWASWSEALAPVAGGVFAPEAAASARDAAGRLQGLAVLGELVELREAMDVLRDLLADGRVMHGRVGREGVAVLTPLEVRGLSFSTVVFTGLAEGGFPVRGRPDPLLGDETRRGLSASPGVRLPLTEQRDAESTLLFAFACEAARDRLLLLAPRTDAATGRPRLPSRFLLRLASLAAGRPVGQDEFLTGRPLAPVWRHAGSAPAFAGDVVWVDRRERDAAALVSLSGRGRGSAASAYLAAVLGSAPPADRRLAAWRSSRSPEPGAWDGLLGAEAQAALAAHHPFQAELHPTRLETYISCPFSFLLRGVLGLDAPEEPGDSLEMDVMEFGSLAHGILETAYSRVIDEGLDLAGALDAVTEAWRLHCAEAERSGLTGAALAWEVRRDVLLDDLREAVRRDPVFAADGSPSGVEWRFGKLHERVVTLDLEDGRVVRFAGRLDRVDRTPSGARVIDYKTGAGGTERQRLKDGLSIQLPVYQLAVREWWSELGDGGPEPAVISTAYRLVTRRGGFEDLILPADETSARARLRALVSGALHLVDAGRFPRTTRGRCEYCGVGYACGVSAWARARKREHEALAPVVSLQGPQPKDGGDD
jgi:RecB family exonuclease